MTYMMHEIVTCVAYNDVGQAICTAKFIVKETAFIRLKQMPDKNIYPVFLLNLLSYL